MKAKPTPKKEVSIWYLMQVTNTIMFYSTQDAVTEFTDFGEIIHRSDSLYQLTVDKRYDFEEVVKYIENYG